MPTLSALFRAGRWRDAIIVTLLLSLTVAPTLRAARDVHQNAEHAAAHAMQPHDVVGDHIHTVVDMRILKIDADTGTHQLFHMPTGGTDAGSLPLAVLHVGSPRLASGTLPLDAPGFVPSRHTDLPYRPPIAS